MEKQEKLEKQRKLREKLLIEIKERNEILIECCNCFEVFVEGDAIEFIDEDVLVGTICPYCLAEIDEPEGQDDESQ